MSLKALTDLAEKSKELQMEKFGGRLPISREIVGYSKGHWHVRYTFSIQGGYSYEMRWEQDERSKEHHRKYPND